MSCMFFTASSVPMLEGIGPTEVEGDTFKAFDLHFCKSQGRCNNQEDQG